VRRPARILLARFLLIGAARLATPIVWHRLLASLREPAARLPTTLVAALAPETHWSRGRHVLRAER
jgi:hypothetical protein